MNLCFSSLNTSAKINNYYYCVSNLSKLPLPMDDCPDKDIEPNESDELNTLNTSPTSPTSGKSTSKDSLSSPTSAYERTKSTINKKFCPRAAIIYSNMIFISI